MPPLQSDRASRACENCRKLKTRCYPSKDQGGRCLRCETQDRNCSLTNLTRPRNGRLQSFDGNRSPIEAAITSTVNVDERLARLESKVDTLVDRIDTISRLPPISNGSNRTSLERTRSPSATDKQDAPMFLIRGIAEDVGARRQEGPNLPDDGFDPISDGMIRLEDAYQLLSLFRLHYDRWVNFDEEASLDQLMIHVRTSPLLFCSVCVVAARHAPQQHLNDLAPTFFLEAKRLLQSSLLITPQRIEFFQAALLLSLWSTTTSQTPLNIDGWLLTSYTLQQGLASSIATSMKVLPVESRNLRACCVWNHICLAHLQYCAGTGRKPLLQEVQIDRCADVVHFEVSQFEVRMVAELRLYWIICNHCCVSPINLSSIRSMLQAWRKQWAFLFDQPRSQFLEMGYNFALLLAHCRSLHSQASKLNRPKLNEMVRRARDIIDLAMAKTDERTPHLTDHIWHIITFCAIILCQLISTYHDILGGSDAVAPLRNTILGLVDWLRSIGLTSHISRVLAKAIAVYYAKCINQDNANTLQPPNTQSVINPTINLTSGDDFQMSRSAQPPHENEAPSYPLQDLAWTTFFDFNADTMLWPYSSELANSNFTPSSTESWAAFAYEATP